MKRHAISLSIAITLAGCSGRTGEAANENVAVDGSNELNGMGDEQLPASPSSPDTTTLGKLDGLPDDRTPIGEGPIDPKGAQGAGQAMQRFGGLLEQRKFAQARMLWSDDGRASGLTEAEFVAAYDKYAEIHSEVGAPGVPEGAAGSIYVDVPFRLYGTQKGGKPFDMVGPVTLRRVNDVDGSTEQQRQWHISRSGLKPHP